MCTGTVCIGTVCTHVCTVCMLIHVHDGACIHILKNCVYTVVYMCT